MALGNPISLTNNVASRLVSATATAGQTTFTVSGGYRINAISVYRNGVKLSDNEDFTASDGSTVILVNAASLSDTISFEIFDDFRVADAIVSAASSQTVSGNLTVTGDLFGAQIGVQSGGVNIGIAKTLNFIGSGNTFSQTGDTIDISISGGGGGGGLGTAINFSDGTTSPFSYIDRTTSVTENMLLDTTVAGESDSYIVSVIPNININSGVAVTVGAGKTMIIDVLQIGDL
jgi:hypothetical protein